MNTSKPHTRKNKNTHTHLHLRIFTYACKFQTAALVFFTLRADMHTLTDIISQPILLSKIYFSLLLVSVLLLLFFFFLMTWCHSERPRAAQRQVNSNWSKCTCGLSSSQSLGKYPINNPVTTTPVTPTRPPTHTHKPCVPVRTHTITADAQPKHTRGERRAADTCGSVFIILSLFKHVPP